jgi:hypothetical protein
MSKKKPRSKDPHSWIKDTTKKAAEQPEEEAVAAAETAAEPEEEPEADDSGPRRFVVVAYDRNDGRIVALHEMHDEERGGVSVTAARLPENIVEARIALTGALRDKSLGDLHDNHKVDASKKKPALVPKG